MTFVIISGGIDLSVGSMLALSGMVSASLLEKAHMSPLFVIPIVLLMGTALGLFMGYLIQTFDLPPFIITLAGLYLARGLCYVVSLFTIAVQNPFFQAVAHAQVNYHRQQFPFTGCADRNRRGPGRVLRLSLHEVRQNGLRNRRQRAIRPSDGASGGAHQDRDLRLERLLRRVGRDCVHILYALRLRVERKRNGAGHDRGGRDRRDPADRRAWATSSERSSACWSTGSSRCSSSSRARSTPGGPGS